MKTAKSILMGTGSLVLAGLVLAVVAPKAAHAVTAALVQVTNTAANPVIVEDKDADVRNAFQTSVSLSLSGTSGTGVSIPAGTRLATEHVTSACSGPSAGTQPYVILYTTVGAGGPSVPYTLTPTQSPLATQQFQDSEAVKLYGDTLFVSLAFAGSQPVFLSCNVSISGHLVNIP